MSERTEALRMLLIAQSETTDRHTSDRLLHDISKLVDEINKASKGENKR